MIVNVKVLENYDMDKWGLPKYEHDGDAGMDVHASIESECVILPGGRMAVPTGLSMNTPYGYEIQVRPRGGLALKNGITVLNTPGTVDFGYTGELYVILINTDREESFTIKRGDRIAQIVLSKVFQIDWMILNDLKKSSRGSGAFGSTGI